MDTSTRIEQFTRMTQADPDNELGHFSLGKALLEAHRYAEAVAALSRVHRTESRHYPRPISSSGRP